MRTSLSGVTLVASLALLSACGGGGGSGSNLPPTPAPSNAPPVANAGAGQSVTGGAVVTLNGSGTDSDGTIASYAWTQTAGANVTLSSSTAAQPTFTAPIVATAMTLTFSLRVTDDDGALSPASTVTVIVNPQGGTAVTGRVQFVRIPFGAANAAGLNYGSPQNQPARGVTVRALAAGTSTQIATGVTDGNGDYALTVPANASVDIQVLAEMTRTGTPAWNFTVRDLPASPNPIPTNPLPAIHAYTDPTPVTAGAGPKNILIPSGFNTSGAVTGTRASAPFAILDTIYQGVGLVLTAAPNTVFPDLVVDWGANNIPEDGTYFSNGSVQHIVLTADVTADTDEFDQHVIAHEFGHYIEFNFSRADNIGGSHGIGDKLDPRVAFGEGFGYAFGAIVLNQPVTRDSFVESGLGCPNNQCSSTFNVEINPSTAAPGSPAGNFGCWCSESSVWSILWDIYDAVPDGNDTVSLGFIPMWNVLVNQQRTSPAFTTIFSFISALKTANGGSAAAIDTLVSAQNINSAGINAYATNENNAPTSEIPQLASLPVYATATVGGGPLTLRTVNDGANLQDNVWNKLGARRFIRFTSPGGTLTITANSDNPNADRDVDFIVYRASPFSVVMRGEDPPSMSGESRTFATAAGDHIIEVYDCANGCDSQPQGTFGDYDVTVSITQ